MTAFVLNGKHFKRKRGRKGRKRRVARCSLAGLRRRISKLKKSCVGKMPRRKRRMKHLSAEGRSWWNRIARMSRASNGRRGRRRRKARNSSGTWIPAFRNPSWVPAYAYNSISSIKNAATANLKIAPLKQGAAALTGFLLNTLFTNLALTRLPFVPAALQGMIGRTGIGLVMSGLTGLVLSKTPARSYASTAAVGATAGALAAPFAMLLGRVKAMLPASLRGLGDYLTPGDVARARSLGYLTVAEASGASPLNGLGCCNMGCDDGLSGANTVAEELNVAG